MNLKPRIYLVLVVMTILVTACSASSGGNTNGNSQPGNGEDVLFFDDFSNPDSGWDHFNAGEGVMDYKDGKYQIFVNAASIDFWANPGLSFKDTRVEVDATKVGGDNNNDFGVICRYKDKLNFYFFIISSDGFYGIGKMVDGAQELIGQDELLATDASNQGDALNKIRADCIGSNLTIYVNDSLITSVQDGTFSEGDVGLLAGTYDWAGTDIHFDNFKVLDPSKK
jgi:hypothetical protein